MDDIDRGLQRLLQEERERTEQEMRRDVARARLAAGDESVKLMELGGDLYSRIQAIKDVRSATGLGIREAKAFVDAYKWDRERTIEAAHEYAKGVLPQPLTLKPKMSVREWVELRAAIEAEPDIERYKCKLAQLYLYLLTRSTRFRNAAMEAEGELRAPDFE